MILVGATKSKRNVQYLSLTAIFIRLFCIVFAEASLLCHCFSFVFVKDLSDINKNQIPQFERSNLFFNALELNLAEKGQNLDDFCSQSNILHKRILQEYGAVFVGEGEFGNSCYFENENQLQSFQEEITYSEKTIKGVKVTLQAAAMQSLFSAVSEAKALGLSITPRGTSLASRRSFFDTLKLWHSRVNPGLIYWVKKGKISSYQAQQIREMPIITQAQAILELEEMGFFLALIFQNHFSILLLPREHHNIV